MKLKQLEASISQLVQFQNPKALPTTLCVIIFPQGVCHVNKASWSRPKDLNFIDLEQYSTGAHIASRMLYTADNSFGDIRGKVVADFGCGCGTLGVAASLLSADYVIGIDIDAEALDLAKNNSDEFEVDIDFVQANIADCCLRGLKVDTIVTNPPFGTRKKGADMVFLSSACQSASSTVYSLHKTTTRDYVRRTALRDFGAKTAEVLCELRYDLPALYKFHKKQEVDIMVDLWRFTI